MKTQNIFKYAFGGITTITIIAACLSTGGDHTSLMIVFISSIIVIAASIKK